MSVLLIKEDGSVLGQAFVHECPRRDEAIFFQNQTYRVVDVAHPTNDEPNHGIHITRVLVRVEDVRWLDSDHLS